MKILDISTKKYPSLFTTIDDADFEIASLTKWWPNPTERTKKDPKPIFYARGRIPGGTIILLHRLLVPVPIGFCVDHVDRNTLNNQRSNLRVCTQFENQRNRPATRAAKYSRHKGVFLNKKEGKFIAKIGVDGIHVYLGYFEGETEAAIAYNKAALKYHGEFALLNNV